jgi:hypothetical protein
MRTKLFKNNTHLEVLGIMDMNTIVKRSLFALTRKRWSGSRRLWRGTLGCGWRVWELGRCGLGWHRFLH